MAVYVDNARLPFGRMLMAHMVADSTAELMAMADRIGVHRRWLQEPGTSREHFDVCLDKRALALRSGAIAINGRQLAAFLRARRLAS